MAASAIQEARLIADLGHHDGFARLDHLAGDAFARCVDAARLLIFRKPHALVSEDLAGTRMVQVDHAADDAHLTAHDFQHHLEDILQPLAFGDGPAQPEHQRQNLGTADRIFAGCVSTKAQHSVPPSIAFVRVSSWKCLFQLFSIRN